MCRFKFHHTYDRLIFEAHGTIDLAFKVRFVQDFSGITVAGVFSLGSAWSFEKKITFLDFQFID